MPAQSFRDILNEEFQRRVGVNHRYSLRAFARDVDVSPAFLSQIIGGKRRLSEDRAEQIADKLSLNRKRRESFLKFVRAELTSIPSTRARLLKEARRTSSDQSKFQSVSMNHFRMLSDWYHFSILELTRIKMPVFNAATIALKLGISETAAGLAIERLKNLKLLQATPAGFKKTVANYTTGNIPSVAIRNFHRQMLKKAIFSIEAQDPIDRDISGITMAIDPAMLPKAKQMIAEFRRELMTALESSESPTAIYHFSSQLFRLDLNDIPKKVT